jgi:hypothetical protein
VLFATRQGRLLITIAVVIAGAAVAGAVFFMSGRAQEVNLTTASLVPGDAVVYVALNTDLSSGEWVSAFRLATRLSGDNAKDSLRDAIEDEGGVDWERDVAPFLGGNAALFLLSVDVASTSAEGGLILRCKDGQRCLDVILREGPPLDPAERSGVRYYINDDEGVYVARLGDHIVATTTEDALFAVVDVQQGRRPALSANRDFQALRDELTRSFLSFSYLNMDAIADSALEGSDLGVALREIGLGGYAFRPMAYALSAKGDSFQGQAASLIEPGVSNRMLQPRESRFARVVPAETAIFFSTTSLGETWRESIDASRGDVDAAIRENTEFGDLDEFLDALGSELGLGDIEAIVDLFWGETALALWFPTGDEDAPAGLLLTEVRDPAGVMDVIDRVFADSPLTGSETVNGVEMRTRRDGSEPTLAVALDGNDLLAGTEDAVRAVLQGPRQSLAGASRFRDTVRDLPHALGTFLYLDLHRLIRLGDTAVPGALDQAERVLNGLVITMVEERGIARIGGALVVKED